MTDDINPQLSAAAVIVVEAAKLAHDQSVPGTHRYMTLSLMLAEIALLQQSVLMPGIAEPPHAKKAATLAAVVANVIERLGRADRSTGARQLLQELSLRIDRALAAGAQQPGNRSH